MITTDLTAVIKQLQANQLVAIPTETVYGLAGNAFQEAAIRRIFELKKRPLYNPLIVHIKSGKELHTVAKDIPEKAYLLAETFWPGPLTMVLNKQAQVPELISAGKNTVAVRVPKHPLTLELLNSLDFPLAAPSANPFGSISPTSAQHVLSYFEHQLDFILDGGSCDKGIESTIVGFENNEVVLYRHGSISLDEIEAVVGKVQPKTSNDHTPEAPGMLTRHYAPATKTYLSKDVARLMQDFPNRKIGLLLFQQKLENAKVHYQEVLSESGNLEEAMKNLYAALHRLDQLDLDLIIAEKLPAKGLGISLNDRLERATKN